MARGKYKLFNLLRVLPFLFPGLSVSQNFPSYNLHIYDSSVTGYYFLAPRNLGVIQTYAPVMMVMNEKGEVVYYKPSANNGSPGDFKIQPNGMMSYYKGDEYFLLDSTFNVVDSVSCVGLYTDGHDLQILGNNHYLLMGLKDSIMDLSSYNYFNDNGSPGSPNATVTGIVIQELDANKNLVFEWHSLTHFQFDDVDEHWLYNPVYVDWTHSNSVELATDGNILLSSRNFNEITKIDRTTGAIIWRLGGKENQFTFINDSLIFRAQHDIRCVANGNVTLFDNGNYAVPHGARGIEYSLDEINKIATLVWSYTHDPNLWSNATGNNHRVAGSRNVVNYGHRNSGDLSFSFIDSLNNPISEMYFTDSSASYRVFFYPELPWGFQRPQVNCDKIGNNYYLTTTAASSSYQWSNGATTASIQVTATGTYYVYVDYGEGFIKSEKFEVLSVSNPCSTTLVSEQETPLNSISAYPNPSESCITIHYPLTGEKNYRLVIADPAGKEIFKDNLPVTGSYVMNTENFEKGIYFLRVGNYTCKFIKN